MNTTRPRRLFLLLAVPALLAAATLGAPTTASAVTYGTGVVCTTYHAQANTATIRFGYDNLFETIESIGPGDYNYFTPPPADPGQPEQFIPGNGSFDLTRAAGSPPLSWVLDGVAGKPADFAVADLPFERPCPERGPSISGLTPPAVAKGADPRALSIFGQGLAGGTVAVSGDGVTVTTADPGTEQRLDATVTVVPGAATGPRDVLVTAPDGDEVGCRGCLMVEPDAPPVVGPAGPAGERGPAGPAGTWFGLKSARSSVPFLTFVVVTELFFSWRVPTLFGARATEAATAVPERAMPSARQATTIDGEGRQIRSMRETSVDE